MEIKETAKQAFVYLEALLDARACFAAVKLSENDMNCLYYQTVRMNGVRSTPLCLFLLARSLLSVLVRESKRVRVGA